jgi:hypothetical protein
MMHGQQNIKNAILLQRLVTVTPWSCLLSGADKGLRHISKDCHYIQTSSEIGNLQCTKQITVFYG